MKNIIKNNKNLFLSKTLRRVRKNVGEKFNKLYLKDITPSAKRGIYIRARSALTKT